MAGDKALRQTAGQLEEFRASQTTAGVANAGDFIGADDTGYLDASWLPAGVGPDIKNIQASENLSAGDYVNVHSAAGAFRVRKADASASGKHAHGFVKAAVTSGNQAAVYFEGLNTGLSALTPGDVFLSASTAGAATNTAPSGSAQVVQRLGVAVSATEIDTEVSQPILLAT